jgi:hypothetical protein
MIKPYDPEAERPNRRRRLWAFLNSNFGLWLLSGLFIGLLTFSWSEYKGAMDAGMRKLLAEHPPATQAEHEAFVRKQWPEYEKLRHEIELQRAADRARKLDILQHRQLAPQPKAERPAG